MAEGLPEVLIETRADLRAWLEAHHADSPGIWLVRWKHGHGPAPTYDEVVEEVLCFGWIDSTGRRIDEQKAAIRLTPRRPTSGWSRVNKERIERLVVAGSMAPAGLAVVAAAKASGTWSALDAAEALEEPDDLVAAFAAEPSARAQWDGFPPSARKALLSWLGQAKRPDTRSRRVHEIVAEAAGGRRANQWPRPPAD